MAMEQLRAGLQHHKAGRLQQAEALYRQFLSAHPEHPDGLHLLGLVLRQSGRNDAAEPFLRRAVALNPRDPLYFNNLGNTLRDRGKLSEAAECYRRALALKPDLASAWSNLGRTLHDQGELKEAIEACRRALELRADLGEAWHNLGMALSSMGKHHEAVEAHRRALELKPEHEDIQCGLGRAYYLQGRMADAIDCYERILARSPEQPGALNELGLVYHAQGRVKEAAECFERVLERKPDHVAARCNLLQTRKSRPESKDAEVLEELLKRNDLSDEEIMRVHFALGHAYDGCGLYQRAFEHMEEANRMRRRDIHYDPDALSAYVDRIVATFSAELLQARAHLGCESDLPVFIVGMPRSGTTLVEQIVSSHPEVSGAGELSYFAHVASDLAGELSSSDRYPECVRHLDEAAAERITSEYLKLLGEHAQGARCVTDKMPYNFLHLGLIRLLFPNARIVHCRRHPIATCLSIYSWYFAPGSHRYAYDLVELGRYYQDYERVMAHWRSIFPAGILEVQYEDLVRDQEAVSRRLIEFLGFEWDERCLEFHRNPRAVLTASMRQVREPIYSDALTRWKQYEPFLGVLMQALGTSRPAASSPALHGPRE